MTDTAKLRRMYPLNVAELRNTIVHDLHNVCDELDKARADARAVRKLAQDFMDDPAWWNEGPDLAVRILRATDREAHR